MNFQFIIIIVLLAIKTISILYLNFVNSSSLRKLTQLSTFDKICRIIQYASSALIGNNEPFVNNLFKYFNLHLYISISNIKQISSTMSISRKILRFLRAPCTVASFCKNTSFITNFKYQKTTYIEVIEISQWFGDFFDIVFYLTDHFSVFFIIGLVKSKELQLCLEFIGHVAWILNASFYMLSALVTIYYFRYRNKSQQKEAIYMKGVLDLISNWMQFLLGFAFIYPRWLSRQLISTMVITSSVSKLIKLKYS